jgi:hypothetical protein
MALRAKSLFLYNLQVTTLNQNIPFRAVTLGPELTAVVPVGYYSLTSLLLAIKTAMQLADPAHVYTVTADRTISGGTQNRVTIATSGTYLDLLFLSGMTAATSIAPLIGFSTTDQTGATTYTGTASSGTALIPTWWGNNYQPPQLFRKNFGSVNVASNGTKEAITWSIMQFIGVEFKFEPYAVALTNWPALINWMIQQKPFDFTPEITSPNTAYQVTLDKSPEDGKGLGWNMKEMLPDYPFAFQTGAFTMRIIT